MGVAVVYSD